jgi:hypothetical protein
VYDKRKRRHIMATLPFLIFFWWLACKMEMRCDKKLREHRELERNLDAAIKKARAFRLNSKLRYRTREDSSEDDELFLTDLGDFDDTFRL